MRDDTIKSALEDMLNSEERDLLLHLLGEYLVDPKTHPEDTYKPVAKRLFDLIESPIVGCVGDEKIEHYQGS